MHSHHHGHHHDFHHGHHHHGHNFENDFDPYRNSRRAYPHGFVFPDEYDQLGRRPQVNQFQPQGQNQFGSGQQEFFPQQQQQQQIFPQQQAQQQPQQQQQTASQQQRRQQQQPQQRDRTRNRPTSTAQRPPGYFTCLNGCLSTHEYNPICGSDQMTYQNIQRLNCARQCGTSKCLRSVFLINVRSNGQKLQDFDKGEFW